MRRFTVILAVAVAALAVVSATPAAEPTQPKNAAQWCKAWAKGDATALNTMQTLYGSKDYAKTFERKTKSGKVKKNLHGACVSATAKKLAAAKGEKDDDEKDEKAESAATAACKKEQQASATTFASAYRNFGQCVKAKQAKATP